MILCWLCTYLTVILESSLSQVCQKSCILLDRWLCCRAGKMLHGYPNVAFPVSFLELIALLSLPNHSFIPPLPQWPFNISAFNGQGLPIQDMSSVWSLYASFVFGWIRTLFSAEKKNQDSKLLSRSHAHAVCEGEDHRSTTHEHGPRLTVNHEKNAPVWWGVNVFTSNIAVGCGPVHRRKTRG